MEVSPRVSTVVSSSSPFMIHANHVLFNTELWQKEVRRQDFDLGHYSMDRYRIVHEEISKMLWHSSGPQHSHHPNHTHVTASQLFHILRTPPVHNDHTLATILMNLGEGCFYIARYNETTSFESLCPIIGGNDDTTATS